MFLTPWEMGQSSLSDWTSNHLEINQLSRAGFLHFRIFFYTGGIWCWMLKYTNTIQFWWNCNGQRYTLKYFICRHCIGWIHFVMFKLSCGEFLQVAAVVCTCRIIYIVSHDYGAARQDRHVWLSITWIVQIVMVLCRFGSLVESKLYKDKNVNHQQTMRVAAHCAVASPLLCRGLQSRKSLNTSCCQLQLNILPLQSCCVGCQARLGLFLFLLSFSVFYWHLDFNLIHFLLQ